MDARSLYEEVTLVLNMNNNTLNATTLVGVNQTFLRSLAPLQMLSPGCACGAIEVLQTSEVYFDLDLQNFELLAISGDIEQEFDLFMSTILKLFTSSFSSTIPVFLNAMIAGPTREKANELIATTIEGTKFCSLYNPVENSTLDREVTIYVFSGAGKNVHIHHFSR